MPWLVPYFWQLIIQRGNRLQWLEASVFLTIITEALSILESPVHHHNRWSSSLPSSQRSDLRRCGWSLHELQEEHATSQHLVRDLQAFGSHQWRTPILMSSRYSSYIIVPIDIAHLDSTWNMGCLRISGGLLMVPQQYSIPQFQSAALFWYCCFWGSYKPLRPTISTVHNKCHSTPLSIPSISYFGLLQILNGLIRLATIGSSLQASYRHILCTLW